MIVISTDRVVVWVGTKRDCHSVTNICNGDKVIFFRVCHKPLFLNTFYFLLILSMSLHSKY